MIFEIDEDIPDIEHFLWCGNDSIAIGYEDKIVLLSNKKGEHAEF